MCKSWYIEFDRLLEKHATQTGLPVIVDFYSDGCGPCRMMAPIFKKLAGQVGQDKAVFAKVDTNQLYELSNRYQVRGIPTFIFFVGGKKVHEFSGAGEAQLRQYTQDVVQRSERENTILSLENLTTYYKKVDPSKATDTIQTVFKKCVDMNRSTKKLNICVGSAASQLARKLKSKYKDAPKIEQRFSDEDRNPDSGKEKNSKNNEQKQSNTGTKTAKNDQPNLHLATKEDLLAELQRRADAEEDAKVDEEDDDDAEFEHGWTGPGDFPERVVIIGGGPAGMSAAIYAARAGLKPLGKFFTGIKSVNIAIFFTVAKGPFGKIEKIQNYFIFKRTIYCE